MLLFSRVQLSCCSDEPNISCCHCKVAGQSSTERVDGACYRERQKASLALREKDKKILLLGAGYVSAPVVDYLTRDTNVSVTVGNLADALCYYCWCDYYFGTDYTAQKRTATSMTFVHSFYPSVLDLILM